jgi:hypothetical protein
MPSPILNRRVLLNPPVVASDSSPGGFSDVWCWEEGIGLQWETDIFMTTE